MDPDPLLSISDRKSGSLKKFLDQELIFYGGLVDTGGRVSKLIDKTLFSSCVTGMLLLKNFLFVCRLQKEVDHYRKQQPYEIQAGSR